MDTKNKLKIAIAGLGFGKKVHLEALKESNYLTPIAIYHYEKKQKSILEKETGLEFFHNWEDLVKSQEIDGIIIATPPESRFELAKQALENAIAGGWKDLFPLKQSYKPEEPEFKPKYFKASDNDLPPTLAEMGKTAKELMEGQL